MHEEAVTKPNRTLSNDTVQVINTSGLAKLGLGMECLVGTPLDNTINNTDLVAVKHASITGRCHGEKG